MNIDSKITKKTSGTIKFLNLAKKATSYIKTRGADTNKVFQDIYKKNKWGGVESVSGRGSDLQQTRIVINEFPAILQEFDVHSVLDIPCGDFNWMQHVDLNGVMYFGADIVDEIIKRNSEAYENKNTHFSTLDLIKSELPRMDLIFCRDCLVHLPFRDIFLALHNMSRSGSKYLLTTTFTSREINKDIQTGEWRTLNFQCAPFFFPEPVKIINEGCTEGNGIYHDKSLGLWHLQDIKECLMQNNKIK
jgi:hypothetical protein